MFSIPALVRTQFQTSLQHHAIPPRAQAVYHKWLRYYLDFCHKYDFPQERQESLPHFLKKFQDKKHMQAQQEQAAHAISLYDELLDSTPAVPTPNPQCC